MPEVPLAPMAPNAGLVAPLSVVVMIGGVILVLSVLGPVRRAFARAASDLTYLKPRPKQAAQPVVATAPAQPGSTSEAAASPDVNTTASPRREIDDFDLALFDS